MDECRKSYQEKHKAYDVDQAKHINQFKEDIQSEREGRDKLRPPSQTTSVGSSVTIFPSEVQLSPGESEDSPVDEGSNTAEETVEQKQDTIVDNVTEDV